MKRLWAIVLLSILPISVMAEDTEVIMVNGNEYTIIIPEDLRTGYLRAMQAYLEESEDFKILEDEHNKYKKSAEALIESKDGIIAKQKELIASKERQIELLQTGTNFAIIPSLHYGRDIDGNYFGVGASIILFDSFFAQAQAGYPFEFTFGVGWKF